MGKKIMGIFSTYITGEKEKIDIIIMQGVFTAEEINKTNQIIKQKYNNRKMMIGTPQRETLPDNILEMIQDETN